MVHRPPERSFFVLFMHYWLPVLLYMIAILVVSAQEDLKPPLRFPFSDKVFHVVEYLGLGLVLVRALRATMRIRRPAVAAWLALCCGISMGILDELFQSFVPGRESAATDLVADTVGLAIAQLIFAAIRRA
jgi:VanZ family protein